MLNVTLLMVAWSWMVASSTASSPAPIGLNAGSNASIQAICGQLQSTLGADIITMPSESNYAYLVTEPWSATVWQNATCIATPRSTSDTQKIVSVLATNNVPFAVRSGGHSPNRFDANIEAGVLIATDNLDQVSYNPGTTLATFGPGLRWDAVYTELDKYNVTLVGGRVMDVGVGGLMLGGGLSYLSDLYGMACDNVVSYEVCTCPPSSAESVLTFLYRWFWATVVLSPRQLLSTATSSGASRVVRTILVNATLSLHNLEYLLNGSRYCHQVHHQDIPDLPGLGWNASLPSQPVIRYP